MGDFKQPRPDSKPKTGCMTFTNHGGYCCGASHLSSFTDVADLERSLLHGLYYSGREKGQFEIILIDDQMTESIALDLAEMGWSYVNRFKNSNSGSYCNVFLINTGQTGDEKKKPQWAKHFKKEGKTNAFETSREPARTRSNSGILASLAKATRQGRRKVR